MESKEVKVGMKKTEEERNKCFSIKQTLDCAASIQIHSYLMLEIWNTTRSLSKTFC